MPRKSVLTKQSPFLDDQGILKIDGCLQHSLLVYDEKHPIIFSQDLQFTNYKCSSHEGATWQSAADIWLHLAALLNSARFRTIVKTRIHRWHFNLPTAPHFGELWEAAVKAMKHHIRRMLRNATLIYQMSTLLAQVEASIHAPSRHSQTIWRTWPRLFPCNKCSSIFGSTSPGNTYID